MPESIICFLESDSDLNTFGTAQKNAWLGIDFGTDRETEIRSLIEDLAKGYLHSVPLARIYSN